MSTLGLFDHAEIGSNRRKYTSVGMLHTNPIKDVLDEAEQLFGQEQRVSCLLSLGAGAGSDTMMPSNLAYLEVHGLLQAMEMQQKMVTQEFESRFGGLESYYRFSAKGISSGSLSDWTHWDADNVDLLSRTYLDIPQRSTEITAAVTQLKEGGGTVTLSRLSGSTAHQVSSIISSSSTDYASGAVVTAKAIPPVTPFFVLRKKAWGFMDQNLSTAPMNKQNIFLLSGLGGCGKSTLFSYYVQVYGAK
jgi:hypothetical protein